MRTTRLLLLFAASLLSSLFVACVNTTALSSGCDGGPTLCGCTIDSDCPSAAPRCDPATLKCAPCLPQNDNCAAGTKCLADGAGSYRCATNCISNSDCPQFGLTISCCSSHCIDTTSDPANCGACGKSCPTPANASPACSMSTCGLGACTTGYADCNKLGSDGCEADTTSDVHHCGACGTACPSYQNGTATCTTGQCGHACTTGYADCNNSALDGCETNTATDPRSCGACGNSCLSLPNATSSCTAGACLIVTCVSGYHDCDHQNPNGCEVNTSTDPANCGACGTVCAPLPNATGGCSSGECGIGACKTNYADCDGIAANGCETPVNADPKNCGACSHACTSPNATTTCTKGNCIVTGCIAGFADCNKLPADGCEANLGTDPLNCGGCGTTCSFPNANPSCSNGTCSFSSCNASYADCDKMLADGCEINTQADLKNCGGCGNTCSLANATQKCALGACAILMCNANYADCDQVVADGCEVNTQTDVKNCGACAMACALANATSVCTLGKCAVSMCNAGYGDCDMAAANGCEVNTQTDSNNCGKCGTLCGNGKTCVNGACSVGGTLLLVYADADANKADVQAIQQATGLWSSVTTFNATVATPTVAQLQASQYVLVFSDSTFSNPTTLGNNLATYWLGGGKVTIATFANVSAMGLAIGGLWGDVAGPYMTFQLTAYSNPNSTLGTKDVPGSPILAGVTTLAATTAFGSIGSLINGAVRVASWNDGRPLVVSQVVQGRNRCDLNMYPASAGAMVGLWTGDGATLIANCLLYNQ